MPRNCRSIASGASQILVPIESIQKKKKLYRIPTESIRYQVSSSCNHRIQEVKCDPWQRTIWAKFSIFQRNPVSRLALLLTRKNPYQTLPLRNFFPLCSHDATIPEFLQSFCTSGLKKNFFCHGQAFYFKWHFFFSLELMNSTSQKGPARLK